MGPLYALTKEGKFQLEEIHEKAVKRLKEALVAAPALALQKPIPVEFAMKTMVMQQGFYVRNMDWMGDRNDAEVKCICWTYRFHV